MIHAEEEINSKSAQVIQKSNEWGSKIPIGIFYQNEQIPAYQERITSRIDNYMENPPSKQNILGRNNKSVANISSVLDDLRVDK
jgi:2-oxoglutarate ferredoxin oxidoreductase subunit beta